MKEFDEIIQYLKNLSDEVIIKLQDNREEISSEYINDKISDELLKKCPFGEYLCKSVHNNKSREHLFYMIVGGVNIFSSKRGEDITSRCNEYRNFYNDYDKMICSLIDNKFLNFVNDDYLKNVCIISCLYHDIGKSIAKEKHPSEGYQIIEGLGAVTHEASKEMTDLEYFKEWLTKPLVSNLQIKSEKKEQFEKEKVFIFRFFTKLLRYHDIWGNITTGEASIIMLAITLDITESREDSHLVFLGSLLLLNIADQYATVSFFNKDNNQPQSIPENILKNVIQKWDNVYKIIKDSSSDKESIKVSLMEIAEKERSTVERICFLLEESGILVDESKINDILRSVCGGRYADFCKKFGAVRLCYALRFFKKIANVSRKKSKSHENQCYNVINILNRIVITYESLISTNKEQGIITGIEMSWLTRNNEIGGCIVNSLIDGSPNILSWIDDEISAFPCG